MVWFKQGRTDSGSQDPTDQEQTFANIKSLLPDNTLLGVRIYQFDADLRLTAWNSDIQQILNLSDEDLAARPTYGEYLRMLADRGEYGTENVEATLSGFLEDHGKELRLERVRPDGTVVEFEHSVNAAVNGCG